MRFVCLDLAGGVTGNEGPEDEDFAGIGLGTGKRNKIRIEGSISLIKWWLLMINKSQSFILIQRCILRGSVSVNNLCTLRIFASNSLILIKGFYCISIDMQCQSIKYR